MSETTEKYKIIGNQNLGLYGATMGFFIGFAAVTLFGPTSNKLEVAMGLSATLVGLLVAIPNLTGSLLRIPFAAWTDKIGSRKPLLILLYMSIIGMAGLLLTIILFFKPENMSQSYYPLFILFGALAGCGIATFSVGISQTSYWFPKEKQGKVLGFYGGVGNLAPGIFLLIVPFALSIGGLSGSYLFWLVLLASGTLVFYKIGQNAWYFQLVEKGVPKEEAKEISKSHGQELFPSGKVIESLKISAKKWRTWVLVGLYFTSFGGFIALAPWFPKYWFNFHTTGNIDFTFATIAIGSVLAGIFVIIGSITRVYAGNIADKITGEKTTLLGILVLLAGSILMTLFTNFLIDFVALLIMGIGMGVMNAAVFKLVPKYVPDAVGGAAGWVGGLGAFGGFVIPPIMGAFVDDFSKPGYAYGFSVFIVLALVCMFFVFILSKNKENIIQEEKVYVMRKNNVSNLKN